MVPATNPTYSRYADFVVTNSFHGTVFSIIFKRPFAAMPIHGSGMNDRIATLLSRLGLEDRVLTADRTIEDIYKSPIDWERTAALLEDYKKEGIAYLKKVINIAMEKESTR